MPFDLNPWEIRDKSNQIFSEVKKIYSFSFFDPFIERLALKVAWKSNFPLSGMINVWGDELDIDWVSSNLLNSGFFSIDDAYFVWNSEKISKHVTEFIRDNISSISVPKLVFSAAGGKNSFHDFSKKSPDIISVSVKRPSPWTWIKYVRFLEREIGVKMDDSAREYILESAQQNSGDIIPLLKMVKSLQQERALEKVTKNDIDNLTASKVVDKFKLVSFLGNKNFIEFYKQLLDSFDDINQLRELLRFAQSYLLKIVDPSYVEDKGTVSSFDREILTVAPSWELAMLDLELKHISMLEIMSKSNQYRVWEEIRLRYLKECQATS